MLNVVRVSLRLVVSSPGQAMGSGQFEHAVSPWPSADWFPYAGCGGLEDMSRSIKAKDSGYCHHQANAYSVMLYQGC